MVFKNILKKRASSTGDQQEEVVQSVISRDDPNKVSRGSSASPDTTPPPVPTHAKVPSIDAVPNYVHDLACSRNTSGDRATRALRKLFAVSEHASFEENRCEMIRAADGKLVPVLLEYLGRCDKGSSEQYLALLVLNNLCMPSSNKRLIALEHHGAKVLSRLLCEDPSCYLIAIILVNLTFVDPDLRSSLVSPDSDIEIVESLSFALRVASLTQEEYEHRQPLVENDPEDPKTPRELLANLLAEDHRQRSNIDDCNSSHSSHTLPPSSLQLFPETARWCLAALKNLTRPSKDATATCALIRVGIVPHILRFVAVEHLGEGPLQPTVLARSVRSNVSATNSIREESSHSNNSNSSHESEYDDSPEPGDPDVALNVDCFDFANSPTSWDSNSAQDAALFIILNLSAAPVAREYIREVDAVHHLSMITQSERQTHVRNNPFVAEELLEFQRMKARMALAYLMGSEGHFGQPRSRAKPQSPLFARDDDMALIVTEAEVTRLVELLAITLHRRAKEGAGGYSAATFSTKYVLLALRCLLTHYENQVKFANAQGAQLNTLLMKVLALHSLQSASYIDAEAAEHACFSLYLLSSYGFQDVPFLPSAFGHTDTQKSLAAKVLTSYLNSDTITPPGKHAATQLCLRLRYLLFESTAVDLAVRSGSSTTASDFAFEPVLCEAATRVKVANLKSGAKPDENIFDRPILRRRIMRLNRRKKAQISWDDNAAVESFPNALQAIQDLSFNSNKVRHLDAIDDILIANNVVHSAKGDKTESYNYLWSWQDTAGEIQRHLEQQNSSDSFLPFGSQVPGKGAIHSLNLIDTLCGSSGI